MTKHLLLAASALALAFSGCFGQNTNKDTTLDQTAESLDALEEAFEDNRERLQVLPLKQLRKFKQSTNALKHAYDTLEAEAEARLDSVKQQDTFSSETEDNDMSIQIDNEGMSVSYNEEEDAETELDPVQFDYLSFDLGFANYLSDGELGAPGSASFLALNEGKSSNVKITAIKAGFSMIDHNLSLLTGLGIDYYNYRFQNQQAITSTNGDGLATRQFDESYDKYKLATQYAFAPLELRYETNPEDPGSSFKIAAGGKFGYLIRSHTKLKRNNGNKAKDFGNFNVNPIRLDAVARIGYGKFLNFYATYGLTPVFENQVQPDLTPVSIGVNIFGFNWD